MIKTNAAVCKHPKKWRGTLYDGRSSESNAILVYCCKCDAHLGHGEGMDCRPCGLTQ